MSRIISVILFITVIILGAGFTAINMTSVDIHYYLGVFSLPLSVVIIVSIVLGTALGGLVLSMSIMSLRYENRRLRKKLTTSEQEVNSLRILPITDSSQV